MKQTTAPPTEPDDPFDRLCHLSDTIRKLVDPEGKGSPNVADITSNLSATQTRESELPRMGAPSERSHSHSDSERSADLTEPNRSHLTEYGPPNGEESLMVTSLSDGKQDPFTTSKGTGKRRPSSRRVQEDPSGSDKMVCKAVHTTATDRAVGAHQTPPSTPQLDETCACCTQSVDADEAVGLLKAAELPESGGHVGHHLSGEVVGLGGGFALLALTGAYRVAEQSYTLIPALRTKIQTYTPPIDQKTGETIATTSNRLKQLKRSLHNAVINLGITISNVATTGGMLASLAIATPVGWGLLAGYATIQTMRNLQLAWRTRQDLNTHQKAHTIAIAHYQQRQKGYLRISASFAIQGIGAALIIGGMASGVGAPLALVGLALVLTGSGGSLWLNNQYTRAYAPRNNSHWDIDRDTLPIEKRHELMEALKEAKEARRSAYRLTPSYQKIKWIKKGLRVVGALPMLTSWQNRINSIRNKLNQQRDEEVKQLGNEPTQRWEKAETRCRKVIADIVTPTPLIPSRPFRVGNMKCSNQHCQDAACKTDTTAPLQLEWGAIRYMLRALCDDEMTKENEVTSE